MTGAGADGARLPPAVATRLAGICARHGLGGVCRAQLATLLVTLGGAAHAPTTVTEPAVAVDVHLADALVALDRPVVGAATRIADLGAGAGFPGLAIAAALPAATVALVESVGRKARWVEALRDAAGIDNATVEAARIEAWRSGLGVQDVVMARALASPAVVCEYAAPLLREGGALVAWQGRPDADADAAAERACQILGLELSEKVRTDPYPGARDHHLHVYLKVRATPERFPRRPGMARKRPLGGST